MFWQINLCHFGSFLFINASCRNCWRELSLCWFCGLNSQKIPLSNRTIKSILSIGFSLGVGQVVLLAKHLSNKHKDPNSTSESTLKTLLIVLLLLRRGDKWIPRTCRPAKLNESANSKSVRKSVSRNEMDNSWETMLTSGLHTHTSEHTHTYIHVNTSQTYKKF